MTKEKFKGKKIKNLFDNVRDCGDEYHINIGQRAGFAGTIQTIVIPKDIFAKDSNSDEDTEPAVITLLRHINNSVHDTIYTARRCEKAALQHNLCKLLGIE